MNIENYLIILITIITAFILIIYLLIINRNRKKTTKKTETTPEWIIKLAEENKSNQIFVVAVVGKCTAYVSMHEKNKDGKWEVVIETPGYIGKNGLGKTREGSSKTPIGTFHFTEAFGIDSNPGTKIGYKQVTEDDYWSGDYNYKYNKMINIKEYPKLDMKNSEHLIDYRPQYKYALNISYNEEGIAGLGSAIFLHCLGPHKPYTEGCIAIPEEKMLKVIKNVREDCVVVIDLLEKLSPETEKEWNL